MRTLSQALFFMRVLRKCRFFQGFRVHDSYIGGANVTAAEPWFHV